VNLGQELRVVDLQRGIDVDDARNRFDLLAKLVAELEQAIHIWAGDGKIDVDGGSLPQRGEVADGDEKIRDLVKALTDFVHLFALREVAAERRLRIAFEYPFKQPIKRKRSLGAVLQADKHLGPIDAAVGPSAYCRQYRLDAIDFVQHRLDDVDGLPHRSQARAFLGFQANLKLGFINV